MGIAIIIDLLLIIRNPLSYEASDKGTISG